MRKGDMSEKQVEEKNTFVRKVVAEGWDIGTTDELLEGGFINITPEGHAEYQNEKANLVLTYHAQEGYVGLLIGAKNTEDFVRFRFHFGERLPELLDLIVAARDTLSLDTHPALVERAIGVCDEVLLEVGGGQMVKLSL